MSKRFFGLAVFAAIIITFFLSPGTFDALFALVFVGIVPITGYSIPPMIMLAVYVSLLILGMIWLFSQSFIMANPERRDVLSREKARTKVAKKVSSKATSGTARKRYQQTAKA